MTEQRRRILVIDDDPDILAFLDLALTGEGYAVETARSLADGKQQLARQLPDLVICDVRLPGEPVFAVLNWLRTEPATRDLPVSVCTGAVQEVEQASERLTGEHTCVLLKPFDLDALFSCIDKLCPP